MAKSISSELLQCAICLSDLQDARALPCLHSFCTPCLDRHIKTSQKSMYKVKRFPCPTCRAWISSPMAGIKAFPNDFRVTKLRDALRSSYSGPKVYTCDVCSIDSDLAESATFYCVECEKYYCNTCYGRHDSKPVLSSHIVIAISENQTDEDSNCRDHKQEPIKFHCKSCDQNVCILCIMGKHENHDVMNLEANVAVKRTELRNCMHHLGNQIWQLHDMMFNLTCVESRIKGQYEETKLSIKKNSNKAASKIYHEESKLIDEINDIYQKQSDEVYQKKEKCRSYMQQFKSLQSRLEAILRFQDMNTTLQSYKEILTDIQDIEINAKYKDNVLSIDDLPNFVPDITVSVGKIQNENGDNHTAANHKSFNAYRQIKFSSSQSYRDSCSLRGNSVKCDINSAVMSDEKLLLGELPNSVHALKRSPLKKSLHSSKTGQSVSCPKLVTQIGGYGKLKGQVSLPYGILFTKDEQLIVGENGNGRLQVFNKEGVSQNMIQLNGCTPRCLTETADGEIVVTDENEKCLKIVNLYSERSTKLLTDSTIAFPFGIVTLPEDKLAVSDMIYESVSVISLSGTKELEFGVYGNQDESFDNPSYLATDQEGNIFVSDSGHHEIKVFDKEGKFLFKFGEYGGCNGQLRYPKGIAIDKHGFIIVADAGNDRVVVFSRLGFYHSTILDKTHGIERPTGLAYSPSELLGVSMPDRHEIYVFELSNILPKD